MISVLTDLPLCFSSVTLSTSLSLVNILLSYNLGLLAASFHSLSVLPSGAYLSAEQLQMVKCVESMMFPSMLCRNNPISSSAKLLEVN